MKEISKGCYDKNQDKIDDHLWQLHANFKELQDKEWKQQQVNESFGFGNAYGLWNGFQRRIIKFKIVNLKYKDEDERQYEPLQEFENHVWGHHCIGIE